MSPDRIAEIIGWKKEVFEGHGGETFAWYFDNRKVADAGWSPFSSIDAAWPVWEWLEKNHPWLYLEKDQKANITLGRFEGKPSVIIWRWDGVKEYSEGDQTYSAAICGETYPHAICLAVLEANKAIK